MAYRIGTGQPLGQAVKRLFDREIVAAITCLTGARRSDGELLRASRKHVRKARVLLQLARRPLGHDADHPDEELRMAHRALGALADVNRLGETLAEVRALESASLSAAKFDTVRVRLHLRASAVEARAKKDDLRARTVRLLDSVRREALDWAPPSLDADGIVREISAAHDAARKARRAARRRPSIEAYHYWRRRVKRETHLFRLIEDLTGNRFSDEEHQLSALARCLGHLQDITVLTMVLADDSPLSRHDTARLLTQLRALALEDRRRAHALSPVLDEKPRALARRLRSHWGARPRHGSAHHEPYLRGA